MTHNVSAPSSYPVPSITVNITQTVAPKWLKRRKTNSQSQLYLNDVSLSEIWGISTIKHSPPTTYPLLARGMEMTSAPLCARQKRDQMIWLWNKKLWRSSRLNNARWRWIPIFFNMDCVFSFILTRSVPRCCRVKTWPNSFLSIFLGWVSY